MRKRGIVRRWLATKMVGWISAHAGEDVFFRGSDVCTRLDLETMNVGRQVEYEEDENDRGPIGRHVVIVAEAA